MNGTNGVVKTARVFGTKQVSLENLKENRSHSVGGSPLGSGYSGPSVANGRVYVTDRLTKPKQVERVHCFDWETGESIWSYTYDCIYKIDYTAGPRATVTVHDGLAYALGAMGHLHCFDAATGEVV